MEKIPSSFFSRLTRQIKPLNEAIARDKSRQLAGKLISNHSLGKVLLWVHIDVSLPTGTVFLWMYWPSFNAALVAPDYVAQHRSVINTYFSLAAACVTTFALSPVFQREGGKWRLSMVRKLLTFRSYFIGGERCKVGLEGQEWYSRESRG